MAGLLGVTFVVGAVKVLPVLPAVEAYQEIGVVGSVAIFAVMVTLPPARQINKLFGDFVNRDLVIIVNGTLALGQPVVKPLISVLSFFTNKFDPPTMFWIADITDSG